ncbi:hypothetical protein [Leptospira sp. GIMC2001]|uniref:hypothetical protein n=1 Tax=Leptospira sp. GIMC2001 TaxID=1513297 RepID=UPI00234BAA74|nr:hypothetical protein [Leptospira sp. GIMC2001]WCL47722.1 hypothetical protein O4O04_00260 [Leptospira sp. GIMC2001]
MDFHPKILRGTTIYQNRAELNKRDDVSVFFAANQIEIGKEMGTFKEPIYEYFFLSIYLGRLLGSYTNGDLATSVQDINSKIDYTLQQDEMYLVEVLNVKYKSSAILDFFLDYIPGGFFRVRRYNKEFKIKIIKKREFHNLLIQDKTKKLSFE